MKTFKAILELIFMLVILATPLLAIRYGWIPSYYSSLFSAVLCLWMFLQSLQKLRKNPGVKLSWFERFELVVCPVGSLVLLYCFFVSLAG